MTDKQEKGENAFPKNIDAIPLLPSSRCKAHDHLKQSIRNTTTTKLGISERQTESNKETTAANDDKNENCN